MFFELDHIYHSTLKLIERYVDDDRNLDRIPQPMFVVGSTGSGKTTVLAKIANNLLGYVQNQLNENYGNSDLSYVADDGEYFDSKGYVKFFDGKQFFSSKDIILAIEGKGNKEGLWQYNKGSIRRIVLIDDIDYFFKRTSFEDQYVLRNYLNHEEAPLIIGSISKIGNELADYRAPFFEGIRLLYLPIFDEKELDKLNLPDCLKNRLGALLNYLPPVVRSFKIASQIVESSCDKNSDLNELLSHFNQLYRIKLDNLPIYSQKIVYNIAVSPAPVTLTELRKLTGIPAGILSTYLGQLVKSFILRKISPKKRGMPYEICDPLFKLWLSSPTINNRLT